MKWGAEDLGLVGLVGLAGAAAKAWVDKIRANNESKKVEVEADVARIQINQTVDQQQFDQLKDIISTLRELLAEERSQRKEYQEASANLADQLNESKAQNNEIKAELKSVRSDLESLKSQLGRKIDQLSEQISHKEDELAERDRRIEELEVSKIKLENEKRAIKQLLDERDRRPEEREK